MINAPLVYRYAHAFFNVFHEKFTHDVVELLKQATAYLKTHQASIQLLHLAHSSPKIKEDVVLQVIAQLGIDPSLLAPLISLLIGDKRIYLLVPILEQLPDLYYEFTSTEHCNVYSAQKLSSDQEVCIKNFLAKATKKNVILTFMLDESLIAGLRIVSNTLYWEKSVRACLNNLRTLQI